MLGDRGCLPNQTFQKCNRHSGRSSAGFSMMLCLARLPRRRPKDYEYHRCFLATRMRHGAGSLFGRRSRTMALAHVLLRLDLGNSRNGQIAHADRRVCQRSNPSPEQEHPKSCAGASISLVSTATRSPLRSRSSGRKMAATVTLPLGQRPSCPDPRTCWVLAVVPTNCGRRLSSARCKARSDPLPWRCQVQSATLSSRGGRCRDPRWPIVRLTLGRQPPNIVSCEKIVILRATCAQ